MFDLVQLVAIVTFLSDTSSQGISLQYMVSVSVRSALQLGLLKVAWTSVLFDSKVFVCGVS